MPLRMTDMGARSFTRKRVSGVSSTGASSKDVGSDSIAVDGTVEGWESNKSGGHSRQENGVGQAEERGTD